MAARRGATSGKPYFIRERAEKNTRSYRAFFAVIMIMRQREKQTPLLRIVQDDRSTLIDEYRDIVLKFTHV